MTGKEMRGILHFPDRKAVFYGCGRVESRAENLLIIDMKVVSDGCSRMPGCEAPEVFCRERFETVPCR
jgi:hypothetical protein